MATEGNVGGRRRRRRRGGGRRWVRRAAIPLLVAVAVVLGIVVKRVLGARPVGPVAVFEGVTYECVDLEEGPGGGGKAHIARIDLNSPGLELFATPVDPAAVARGGQYRLAFVGTQARRNGLDLAVNGALFEASTRRVTWPGQLAHGIDTVVSDGETSHVHEHSYLLWVDEEGRAHQETRKPPSEDVLERARWGVGGQGVALHDGRVSPFAGTGVDRRTAVGMDAEGGLLWLAVFDRASGERVAAELAARGARSAMLLDGGDSSAFYLSPRAGLLRFGTLTGGWRPVATAVGVRVRRGD